ncbi:unnamed protein product, partial [Closterium sp. Naga37s-1]
EALAAKDVVLKVPEFNIVDTAVRGVAGQLSQRCVWLQRFKHLQEIIWDTNFKLQRIHAVRWVSRGEAVKGFAKALPATVVLLFEYKHELYEVVTSFKIHFMLFLFANILAILKDLNLKFRKHQ